MFKKKKKQLLPGGLCLKAILVTRYFITPQLKVLKQQLKVMREDQEEGCNQDCSENELHLSSCS